MKVAVDIDDVTADIIADLIEYHNRVYKTNFTLKDHKYFELYKVWNCTKEEMIQRVYDFYHSSLMDDIKPMGGAVEGINGLAKVADVAFVTSRPGFLHEKTRTWMKKYFPKLDLPVYFTDQFSLGESAKMTKSDICVKLGASIMIEDAPAYAADCAEKNIHVFLYDRPWNKNVPETEFIKRVLSWKDVVEKVRGKKQLNGKVSS